MTESQSESCSVLLDPLQPLYSPQNSPGQNTGVGSLSLLQGIFPDKGTNPGLLHCRQILYQLRYQRSPNVTGLYHFKGKRIPPRLWHCLMANFIFSSTELCYPSIYLSIFLSNLSTFLSFFPLFLFPAFYVCMCVYFNSRKLLERVYQTLKMK